MVATRSTLPPLQWIAEETLTYDDQTNELHRRSCPQATGDELDAGDVLKLVWAPNICADCRPDVTMRLG